MECSFSCVERHKHAFTEYKTLILRRTRYWCIRCGNSLDEDDYQNWKDMWVESTGDKYVRGPDRR